MDEPCSGPDILCGNQIDLYTGPLSFALIMAVVMALIGLGVWLVAHSATEDLDWGDDGEVPRPRRYRFDDAHLDRPIDDGIER